MEVKLIKNYFEKVDILKKEIDNFIFYLVIAGTETSQIKVYLQQELIQSRRKTALADAEFLLLALKIININYPF